MIGMMTVTADDVSRCQTAAARSKQTAQRETKRKHNHVQRLIAISVKNNNQFQITFIINKSTKPNTLVKTSNVDEMSQQHSAESTSSLETSHYQALNVAPDATLDEIRRSYQSLALRFHPDKSNRDQPKAKGLENAKDNDYESGTSNRFIRIDEAWKVLRDEETRRIYDAELMQRACREEYFVNEVLRRADFRHEEEEDYYYHTCRCGGSIFYRKVWVVLRVATLVVMNAHWWFRWTLNKCYGF